MIVISVPLLEAEGVILSVFPLHDNEKLSELGRAWVQTITSRQPLGKDHS